MPAFPRPKTLEERIVAANTDLKVARRGGKFSDIARAAQKLDDLLDELNAKAKLHAEPLGLMDLAVAFEDIGQPCAGHECDGHADLCWDCCAAEWALVDRAA